MSVRGELKEMARGFRWGRRPMVPRSAEPHTEEREDVGFPTDWARSDAGVAARQAILQGIMHPLVRNELSLRVYGLDHLHDVRGPVVFFSNHSSHLDATLITAHSPKEKAAATYKSGFGFHPLGCWCANTDESLAMELRPGNAGSNTASDHVSGLSAALAQIPARYRRNVIVRLDGAGASHDFIEHMLNLKIPDGKLLFTCGWTITETDEADIREIPEEAWKPGVTQDGRAEEDTDVAEITGLTEQAVTAAEVFRGSLHQAALAAEALALPAAPATPRE